MNSSHVGTFDDHFVLMEDWTNSNPLLEAYFLSFMNDNVSTLADQTDQNQANVELDGSSNSAEPRASCRGSLKERIADNGSFNHLRLNTENPCKDAEGIRSPYLTIPPGLSPTSLLDSPVFVSNPFALPSPTTGKLTTDPNGYNQNSELLVDEFDKGKENTFQDANASSYAFKPVAESSTCPYFYAVNKVNPPSYAPQPFISNDPNISDNSLLHQSVESSDIFLQNNAELTHQRIYTNGLSKEQTYNMFGMRLHPPLSEQEVDDGQGRTPEFPNFDGGLADDGYNWRKYGQKPVKGSAFPRSYFKCTHLSCPVKKKVERSVEGHITEITYKGVHNHPKPPSNQTFTLNSQSPLEEQSRTGADANFDWSNLIENLEEKTSSTMGDLSGTKYEPLDQSSVLSSGEEEDLVSHGSLALGCDGEGEESESESKRRRMEPYGSDIVSACKARREPRVVVQTVSDVDILDDGYRWRKYGQKVVKGNPNPRSYYKCTSPNCNVRKHIERSSYDLKSVITTYEGKHNHDVPAARNSNSHINSESLNPLQAQQAFDRARIGNQSRGTNHHQHRPRHGSGPPCVYGVIQQPGLSGQGMAGLVHQYTGQQAFMVPKVEPVSENASTVYEQLMSQLPPLGPQMQIL